MDLLLDEFSINVKHLEQDSENDGYGWFRESVS